MVYELKASEVYWDREKKQFVLNNYLEKPSIKTIRRTE
jgi:lipopolysaccharide export system permease protein